ncbi:N-acyl homoserine lactonase family protein [Spongiivirga citrea]|uniref:MBL fold metallo-hydrolase n=1 Tax=Spongiivirga citrea TaxID=1481457 RepID=A0A6M0CGQ3_9FLAO|nr:N-acyl homoserine lactonase family protein [Spongiivirga citrea]NER17041.1 MBL fold metallo-hydrolase [Spongiivirga citrea]
MKKLLIAFSLIAIVACKQNKKESDTADTTQEKAVKPAVKLYAFSGGTVQANMLELFSQDTTYTGQSKTFADAFYVIEHPDGVLVWDGGLPEALTTLEEPFTDPSGAFTVSRKDSVKNQLASIGMKIDSVKYFSLSHTHFDHTGHANAFKNSTWIVQEAEHSFITSDSIKVQQADNYNAVKELTNVMKIDGDHDVFADGSVIIKSYPGHTPGHSALYIDLPKTGPVLLTGDLYHFEENREFKRVPSFNYDVEMTKKSMYAFEAFAKEKGAQVFIQHSPNDFKKIPAAPAYLE